MATAERQWSLLYSSNIWRTLLEALAQFVVSLHEVHGSGGGGIVGGDGVNEGVEGDFDALKLRLEEDIHGRGSVRWVFWEELERRLKQGWSAI